jgi:phospholipase/carboxylesterase
MTPTLNNKTLSCIEVELSPPVNKSVIWLHGLGADGNDFVPIVPELKLPPDLGIRFVFPSAPVMPITLNNGYEMRAWFDIEKLSLSAKIDREGIKKSVIEVEKLIEKELTRGLTTADIFLAGFSQGAAIALMAGLLYPKKLAGLIALSGFLPLAEEVLENASDANGDVPIFIAHGTFDSTLPYFLGESIATILKQGGFPVSWHGYPMAHSVCSEEIRDLSNWLQKICLGK